MLERFYAKVAKTDACWLWTGAVNGKGYGELWDDTARRKVKAHRFAYEHFIGPVPAGAQVVHRPDCGTRGCVKPEHLQIRTASGRQSVGQAS